MFSPLKTFIFGGRIYLNEESCCYVYNVGDTYYTKGYQTDVIFIVEKQNTSYIVYFQLSDDVYAFLIIHLFMFLDKPSLFKGIVVFPITIVHYYFIKMLSLPK